MSRLRRIQLVPSTLSGRLGLGIVLALVAIALATLVIGVDPGIQELSRILEPPSLSRPLGTDQLGRDQLSRVGVGIRSSMSTALVVLLLAGIGGGLLGMYSGYVRGKVDLVLQRLVDAAMAMPLLVMVLAVVAVFGGSFWGVTVSIAAAFSPLSVRVGRSSVMQLEGAGFLAAAKVSGASRSRILVRHLLPNAIGPVAIVAASQTGAALLIEAALGFLGASSGRITLGGLLGGETQVYMYGAPWLIIWPGVVIGLAVFAINLIGEWVSESWLQRDSR